MNRAMMPREYGARRRPDPALVRGMQRWPPYPKPKPQAKPQAPIKLGDLSIDPQAAAAAVAPLLPLVKLVTDAMGNLGGPNEATKQTNNQRA
jgi:hypothetical protein